MKRDMNLIIAIMEHLEAQERPNLDYLRELPGHSIDPNLLAYHQWLLVDGGLAAGEPVRYADHDYEVVISDLTWHGHEFLAATRNKGALKQAKKHFGDKLQDVPFSVLTAFLIETAKKAVGL